jgi:hypothetical protein
MVTHLGARGDENLHTWAVLVATTHIAATGDDNSPVLPSLGRTQLWPAGDDYTPWRPWR